MLPQLLFKPLKFAVSPALGGPLVPLADDRHHIVCNIVLRRVIGLHVVVRRYGHADSAHLVAVIVPLQLQQACRRIVGRGQPTVRMRLTSLLPQQIQAPRPPRLQLASPILRHLEKIQQRFRKIGRRAHQYLQIGVQAPALGIQEVGGSGDHVHLRGQVRQLGVCSRVLPQGPQQALVHVLELPVPSANHPGSSVVQILALPRRQPHVDLELDVGPPLLLHHQRVNDPHTEHDITCYDGGAGHQEHCRRGCRGDGHNGLRRIMGLLQQAGDHGQHVHGQIRGPEREHSQGHLGHGAHQQSQDVQNSLRPPGVADPENSQRNLHARQQPKQAQAAQGLRQVPLVLHDEQLVPAEPAHAAQD
mmetsp:Transcript_22652/g.57866  ORF Transcript_22652/g.57866 Transcript_22652/m.57866 type:complete len:360 (-) Transcript_22652:33-1112(-)